jgi:hypothetical protein
MGAESTAQCTWCGDPVGPDEGWRAAELPGARRAVFCRLEHVVPWHIQGPHWEAGQLEEAEARVHELDSCSHCGEPLGDVRVLMLRHRGEHRIPDAFCSVDHLAAWAKAGGRWG